MELSVVSADCKVLKAVAVVTPTAEAEKGTVSNALDSFYELSFAYVQRQG